MARSLVPLDLTPGGLSPYLWLVNAAIFGTMYHQVVSRHDILILLRNLVITDRLDSVL